VPFVYASASIDSSSNGSGTTSFSWSHTVSGTNTILFLFLHRTADQSNGATYNGVNMTYLTSGGPTTDMYLIFYMINPPTGAHTLAVTANFGDTKNCIGVSLNGVIQSVPTIYGAGTSAVTLTTISNNSIMLSSGGSVTAGSNTSLVNSSGSVGAFKSNPLLITPAGSKTLNMTGASNSVGIVIPTIATASFSWWYFNTF
jgi:hypothetical protein